MDDCIKMRKESKIFVAGHRGLVGSAILANLRGKGYTNLVTRTHAELDLTDQVAVNAFFEAEKPEYVFLAAAKVGGIVANEEALAASTHAGGLPADIAARVYERALCPREDRGDQDVREF